MNFTHEGKLPLWHQLPDTILPQIGAVVVTYLTAPAATRNAMGMQAIYSEDTGWRKGKK